MIKYIILLFALTGCLGANIDSTNDTRLSDRASTALTSSMDRQAITPLVSSSTVAEGGTLSVTVNGMPTNKITTSEEKAMTTILDSSMRELYKKHSGLFYLFVAIALAIVVFLWFMVRRTNEYKSIGGGLKALSSVGGVVAEKLMHLSPDTVEHKVISEFNTSIKNKILRLQTAKR